MTRCLLMRTLCAYSSSTETDPWKARFNIIRGRTGYEAQNNLRGIVLKVWPKWGIISLASSSLG